MNGTVISNDNVSIAYQVTGIGEPTLVFVHGCGCNKSYWDLQVTHITQSIEW